MIASSLLGILLFILGAIRDSRPLLARFLMSALLFTSYVMLASAVPGSTDWFQYIWVVQLSAALGLYQHHIQYCRLFPNQVGLLVGISAGLIALSQGRHSLLLSRFMSHSTSHKTTHTYGS